MRLIDLHCDTIYRIYDCKAWQGLYQNDFHVDIQKMKDSRSAAQFFAIWINWAEALKNNVPLWDDFKARHKMLMEQLEICREDIALATSAADLDKNLADNKISAFLTIEEGGIIEGQIHRLHEAYEMGIRLITLTWNYPNSLGFPNSLSEEDYPNQRLTEFGVEVVEEMNKKGMIIDVSHLSDQGFYQVHEISKKPYIASHSNARALQNHGRNLTDDMLKVLGNDGGITGINFCPGFLNSYPTLSVESLIRHIGHIIDKAGVDAVAMGTDFDGIDGKMEIEHIGQMDKLLHALQKAGYSDDVIEKIWYKNARRIIEEVIG